MTRVGVVGLGKLGLPTAITLALKGISVFGYDIEPSRMKASALSADELTEDLDGRLVDIDLRDNLSLEFVSLSDLVRQVDCILIAVETPHGPLHEGTTRLPQDRSDFDYSSLRSALANVVAEASSSLPIGIISTVLPGTVRRELLPLLAGQPLVYCPQFIAMGTVAHDLCNPEFVLLGHGEDEPGVFAGVFAKLSDAPVFAVSYESAELAKVIYNTYISSKVAIANMIQVMSHQTGADSRDVFAILKAATSRITSPAYMGPGLGDGGPCHPRDNIAMSWLVRELAFPADLFSAIMQVREAYSDWLAGLLAERAAEMPVVILGTAYKPGTTIETGSCAVLIQNLLLERQIEFFTIERATELPTTDIDGPAVYFLGTPDEAFLRLRPAPGSVVIDAWQRMPSWPGVETIHVGVPEGLEI